MKKELLSATALLMLGAVEHAQAQSGLTPPAAPNSSYFITSGTTIALPSNWTAIDYQAVGASSGSGCGVVAATGTVAVGGGTAGGALYIMGHIVPSDVANAGSIIVSPGTAGASCVATGTTQGSTGSAPTAGSDTVITIGTLTITAFHGGAGSNGAVATASAGGGSAGWRSNGGDASGATGGTGGLAGGMSGGSGGAGSSPTQFGVAQPGAGSGATGVVGSNPLAAQQGPGAGGSGGGINSGDTVFAGGAGAGAFNINAAAAAGATTCNGTSQNGANGSTVTLSDPLRGVGAGGGASCAASHGGNGGSAAGYGASGGAGGGARTGNTAGSGGTSDAGAVRLTISELLDLNQGGIA